MQMLVKKIHYWNIQTESPKSENFTPCWGKQPGTEHETWAKTQMYAFT